MAKGIPHVLSGRRPKKPIIRPQRLTPAQAAQAAKDSQAAKVAPLHLLDGSVKDLRKALATGKHDAHLEALLEAEENGKTRSTAIAAIEDRM